MTVQLFIPCYVDQLAPHLALALTQILDHRGIVWNYPGEQTCCGQFAFNAGDLHGARRLLRHFLSVFAGDQTILCPSASCVLTVRHHYSGIDDGPGQSHQLAQVQTRLRECCEWLAPLPPVSVALSSPLRLVLHHSCAGRQLGIIPQVRRVLASVSGLTLLEPPAYHSCCGFGGVFAVTQSDVSAAIGLAYLEAILASGAQGLVSHDLSCLIQLNGLIQAHRLPLRGYHVLELLAGALIAPPDLRSP